MTFLLVDTNNLMHRAKYAIRGSTDDKVGLGFHIILYSLQHCWRKFQAQHVVFALEGRSWRREAYQEYKATRRVAQALRTPQEIEEDEYFTHAMNDLIAFLQKRTNVTVLQSHGLEADDLIAAWTQRFPNHQHVIISADSDFQQLIAPNVKLFNGVKNETWTVDGIFDDKNRPVIDKKSGKPIKIEPEWFLFKKIMRGDSSDNIMSAYPGVRETKLRAAYEDRKTKGFDWNAVMQQSWKDHNGQTHRVMDRYYQNMELVDLTAQPEPIKHLCNQVIDQSLTKPKVNGVGIWFMKFAQTYGLDRLSKNPQQLGEILNAGFEGIVSAS
jgi:5'-3' exonuclease